MSSNSKKTSGGKDEKKNPSSKEESPVNKDEAGGSTSVGSTGGGTSADGTQPGSKPGSAGATSREAAQKLLGLAARGEWAPVDQLLKSLEKAMQNVGEDGPVAPLASIMDPVSRRKRFSLRKQFIVFVSNATTMNVSDFQATGMTPLMYAVKDNRAGLLERMIELGADVGARNNASIPRNSKYLSCRGLMMKKSINR